MAPFLDKLIDNFFEKMKKKAEDKVVKDMYAKDPELARKLEKLDKQTQATVDYIKSHMSKKDKEYYEKSKKYF